MIKMRGPRVITRSLSKKVKLEKVQPSPRLPTMSMFRNLSETNKLLKFAGKTIWQLKATLMEIWLNAVSALNLFFVSRTLCAKNPIILLFDAMIVVFTFLVSEATVIVVVVSIIFASDVQVTLVLSFHDFGGSVCSVVRKDKLPSLFTRILSLLRFKELARKRSKGVFLSLERFRPIANVRATSKNTATKTERGTISEVDEMKRLPMPPCVSQLRHCCKSGSKKYPSSESHTAHIGPT
mmetsp:Transcript_61758/g.116270  ORF Transcript_61758/g.116270 Transcript_61758/m.116270 type:complete len:238 (-) Transcript_61758:31-744(-)